MKYLLIFFSVLLFHGCATRLNLSDRNIEREPAPLISARYSILYGSAHRNIEIISVDGKKANGADVVHVEPGTHTVIYKVGYGDKALGDNCKPSEESQTFKVRAGHMYYLDPLHPIRNTTSKSFGEVRRLTTLQRDEQGRLVETWEPVYGETLKRSSEFRGCLVKVQECDGFIFGRKNGSPQCMREQITTAREKSEGLSALF